MVKLLILAYDFPPYVSVGGLRPYSWYKFLHRYDVYPIVVTRQWGSKYGNSLDYIAPGDSDSTDVCETEQGTIVRAPFKPNLANKMLLHYGESKFRILRKLITAFYEFFQFALPIGSKRGIYTAADAYLKQNKVDCIIATGDPFVLFKYASALSKKYSIPWIADYRDPWVQDKSMKSKAYKAWSRYFERKLLRSASRVTTALSFFQKQIETNIKNKKFEVLSNGYDPDIITAVHNIEQTRDALSIAFAGTIYDWHPYESFLNVCNELVNENTSFQLQLHFYGVNKEDALKEVLNKSCPLLETHVTFHPRMNNLELVKAVARQNACLLFNDYSIIGTKIFDYLAVRRKIILCYEDDSEANELKRRFYHVDETETESDRLQADLITATHSGVVARDAKHLKCILKVLHEELKQHGSIECPSIGVEEYSRLKRAGQLAEIVHEIHAARSRQ